MYIQTESTPNPNVLKFVPGIQVMEEGTATFKKADDAAGISQLASVLLEIIDVKEVFFGIDFITISKADDADWNLLKAHVITTIMEHYIAGRSAIDANQTKKTSHNKSNSANEDDDELVIQIKELIDTRVRPAVAEDGGDIIYQSFEDGVVYLELHGACSGCPSSTATLKNGIENMLKHYVPEVLAVEAVNGLPDDTFDL